MKTIRSFTLYFTNRDEMEKAKSVADSSDWCASYETVCDLIDEGEYAIVEFWWDDIDVNSLSQFLNEIG